MAGFEPATSWSQTRRTSQAVLHPGFIGDILFRTHTEHARSHRLT